MYIVYIPFVLTLMMVILLLDVFTGRLSPFQQIGDYFYASHTHSSEFSIRSVYYMASLGLRIFSDIIVAANATAITKVK